MGEERSRDTCDATRQRACFSAVQHTAGVHTAAIEEVADGSRRAALHRASIDRTATKGRQAACGSADPRADIVTPRTHPQIACVVYGLADDAAQRATPGSHHAKPARIQEMA